MSLDAHASPIESRVTPEGVPSDVPVARKAGHPLGALVTIQPVEHAVFGRLYAAGVAAAAVALLATAVWLRPDPGDVGTHRQLGLPPCGFHLMTGLPCPTCGMTTAFAFAVRGQVLHSLRAQVGGFALAVATAAVAILALATAVSGRRVCVNWYRVEPTRLIWLITLGFLAAWGSKIGLELLNRNVHVS